MGGRPASLWSSDGKGVEVSDAKRERNQFRCIVTLHDEGRAAAAAELDMISAYQSMMRDFFEELAALNEVEHTRSWDSEFAEVALAFSSAGPQTVRITGAYVRSRGGTTFAAEGLPSDFLRVRGLAKVQLHADLTMLARLSQALARARAVPLAA